MGALDGFVICQTGTMTQTRAEMEKLIKSNGGRTVATITGATTHLLCAPDGEGTSKHSQAVSKGLTIINETELRELIEGKSKKRKAPEPAPPKKSAKKPAKRAADPEPEPEPVVEESEDAPPPKKSAKRGASKPAAATEPSTIVRKSASQMAPTKSTTQKLTKKGRGVVDTYSGIAETSHIYEEGKDVYQCTLNQTNIGTNNNKFYILQLIEADAGGKWWVWTRWARVGQVGQSKLEPFSNLDAAKRGFCSKFREKTQNNWTEREHFVKVAGKYFLMDMDYGDDEGAADEGPAEGDAPSSIPESKLPPQVQDIIKLITDVKMMTNSMSELEIDIKKMPLGKISKTQVKQGFEVLKKISDVIKGKAGNLLQLSSDFYTIIPHDFGMRTPDIIRTEDAVRKKMDLLDMLADLEIASRLLAAGKNSKENPIDANYAKLKTNMVPLDKSSPEFKLICEYVKNTHGATHTAYKLEVEEVLKIEREGEYDRFQPFSSLHNRMLLWHGSRLTNFMGILSQGLRIAPPEAPVTGYMFGKGVYFADMVTKSANYCNVNRTNPTGLMFLAEVALGDMYKLQGAKYMDKAPPPYHSTMGEGKMAPNPKGSKDLNGVAVPCGAAIDIDEVIKKGTTLLYNEFIVYDVAQINLKYLLKMKFNFK